MFLLNSSQLKVPSRPNVVSFIFIFIIFFFVVLLSASAEAAHGPTKHYRDDLFWQATTPHRVGIFSHAIDGERYGGEKNKDGIGPVVVLAENRTHRRDPLDGFNYYRGGWNITSKHYLFSAGFTAAPLLVVAALWFLGFCVYLLVGCIARCCYEKRNCGCSPSVCAFSLVLLIFFTIVAIVGCTLLYTGQAKFDRSTKGTLAFIVDQANVTVETLRHFSHSMASAKRIGVGQFSLPSKVKGRIDRVTKEITSAADTLETRTDKNRDRISHALNSVRVALISIAAIMLLLALLGSLSSCWGLRFLVKIMMTLGWVLVTVTFILCAVFLVLHNVIGDSCVAMNEWAQRPAAHTALDDIIPCVDSATAQDALNQGKDVTLQLLGIVNTFITNVSNANVSPVAGPAYYNQSGPLVPVVCNPYQHCSAPQVTLSNAANEWSNYVCEVSSSGICTTVGRLTPTYYNQMVAVANVSNGIYQYAPFLVDLGDCTFLWKTFDDINGEHCPGLRRYSKLIFVGLLIASIAVMLSLTLWLPHAKSKIQRREFTTESVPSSSQQFPLVPGRNLSNQEMKMSVD